MPQPADLIKLTMQFDLWGAGGTPEDIAEFSIWGSAHSGFTGPFTPWLDDFVAEAHGDWVADVPATRFSPAVHLAKTIAGVYDTSGHLEAESVFAAAPTDWVGAASQSLPWSNAFVVSLYTYVRGAFTAQAKSKRGRIYLPPLGTTILNAGPGGEMSIGDTNTIRDAIGTWLTHLVGHSGPGGFSFHPGVLSKTHNYFNELLQLSCDNKMDTQRRREKQQTATISTVDWP